MAGPGGFQSEYMNEGVSENHLRGATLSPNKTGLPYSNASTEIYRKTLEARDAAIAVAESLTALEATLLASAAASDIAALPARP